MAQAQKEVSNAPAAEHTRTVEVETRFSTRRPGVPRLPRFQVPRLTLAEAAEAIPRHNGKAD